MLSNAIIPWAENSDSQCELAPLSAVHPKKLKLESQKKLGGRNIHVVVTLRNLWKNAAMLDGTPCLEDEQTARRREIEHDSTLQSNLKTYQQAMIAERSPSNLADMTMKPQERKIQSWNLALCMNYSNQTLAIYNRSRKMLRANSQNFSRSWINSQNRSMNYKQTHKSQNLLVVKCLEEDFFARNLKRKTNNPNLMLEWSVEVLRSNINKTSSKFSIIELTFLWVGATERLNLHVKSKIAPQIVSSAIDISKRDGTDEQNERLLKAEQLTESQTQTQLLIWKFPTQK